MEYTIKSGIKAWAEDDQPREKLINKGKLSLSDAELIAILLGMGTKEHSAVDLAKIILHSVSNNLNELAKLSVSDLIKFKGIGEAKAVSIVAAMELARRRKTADQLAKTKIKSSYEAYNYLKPFLLDLDHEQFWILCLNRNLEVIKTIQISTGGVVGTIADPKIIFKYAIENLANAIVLSHNHPSGNKNPSKADIDLTKSLSEIGKMLEITISDHLIFTNDGYYSFADEGNL